MPNNYAPGVRVIKRKSRWWIVPTIISVICMIVLCGSSIASLLTTGGITVFSTNSGASYIIYAVSFGQYDTAEQAQSVANEISVQGAAGYVYAKDGKHNVLGMIYINEADASKVIGNIKNYKCSILKLPYNKITINSTYNKQQTSELLDSVRYFRTLINNMYADIIKLDTKEITGIALSNNFNYYSSVCKTNVAKLMQIQADKPSDQLKSIIDNYIVVIDTLNVCVSQLIQSSNAGYVAKHAICDVCVHTQKLCNNL